MKALVRKAVRGALHVYARPFSRPAACLDDLADKPPSILVQNISGIGNCLMATPLIAELRRLYPEARIDLVTTPGSAQLLATNPHVTEVIADPSERPEEKQAYRQLTRQHRERRYDVCFLTLLTLGFKYGIRAVLGRVPMRVGHGYSFTPSDDYTPLCTHRVAWDQTQHDVESNLDLLRAVTRREVAAGPLIMPVADNDRAQALEQTPFRKDAGKHIAVCPGSDFRTRHKRWPMENYAVLIRRLQQTHGDSQFYVFCGPDEKEESGYFRTQSFVVDVPIVEGLKLPVYAAALDRCDLVVCGDSLPVHIRSAQQKPLVALYGPTDPARTGPWKCPGEVLTAKCDFAPYHCAPYPPAPEQFPPCMPLITIDEVEQAVRSCL